MRTIQIPAVLLKQKVLSVFCCDTILFLQKPAYK